jgi:site-specific DNA-cytosine methylase
MELVCVNHWPSRSRRTSANHPEARHYCQDIATVRPHLIVPEGYLDLLMASPTCTHHSVARGGKPTSDQQRSDPWHIITWLTELRVKRMIIENVWEFIGWGPVDPRTGKPIKSRKGEYFRAWIDTIRRLGFEPEWRKLNAADYGDATTRQRFILMARSDSAAVAWPMPTHASARATASSSCSRHASRGGRRARSSTGRSRAARSSTARSRWRRRRWRASMPARSSSTGRSRSWSSCAITWRGRASTAAADDRGERQRISGWRSRSSSTKGKEQCRQGRERRPRADAHQGRRHRRRRAVHHQRPQGNKARRGVSTSRCRRSHQGGVWLAEPFDRPQHARPMLVEPFRRSRPAAPREMSGPAARGRCWSSPSSSIEHGEGYGETARAFGRRAGADRHAAAAAGRYLSSRSSVAPRRRRAALDRRADADAGGQALARADLALLRLRLRRDLQERRGAAADRHRQGAVRHGGAGHQRQGRTGPRACRP